tara:strand:- start:5161 stop:5481 length:321 start_codon:yes stop_codon:yes gene_type:complete
MNNRHRNTDVAWDALMENLSKETKQNGVNMSKASQIFSGVLSLAALNGVTAVALMLLNTVVNKAWPALELFTPAIGYFHAFYITLIIWVIWIIKTSIKTAQQRHQQ